MKQIHDVCNCSYQLSIVFRYSESSNCDINLKYITGMRPLTAKVVLADDSDGYILGKRSMLLPVSVVVVGGENTNQ